MPVGVRHRQKISERIVSKGGILPGASGGIKGRGSRQTAPLSEHIAVAVISIAGLSVDISRAVAEGHLSRQAQQVAAEIGAAGILHLCVSRGPRPRGASAAERRSLPEIKLVDIRGIVVAVIAIDQA